MKASWDLSELSKPPQTWPAPAYGADDLETVFFEGMPCQGRPTRVYACHGMPDAGTGAAVPGIVLAHGGGGTAFAEWVRLWNKRGYAAIAMDWRGGTPEQDADGKRVRHAHAGPESEGIGQGDRDLEDQGPWHGVADILLAHSLLASLPGVDENRVGLTGISWGAYLTCIAASVDTRLSFAVPVYGCGFLRGAAGRFPSFAEMGDEKIDKWLASWDAMHYLPDVRLPMLWVTGTNDFAYDLDTFEKSYRLPRCMRTLSVRVGMDHSHRAGWSPGEIAAFADSIVRGGEPLARVTNLGADSSPVWATFVAAAPILRGELNFTRDSGPWIHRRWETIAAPVDSMTGRVAAKLPRNVRAWFFNLIDAHGRLVSTEHVEM